MMFAAPKTESTLSFHRNRLSPTALVINKPYASRGVLREIRATLKGPRTRQSDISVILGAKPPHALGER